MVAPFRLIAEVPRFAPFARSKTTRKKNPTDLLSQARFGNLYNERDD